MTEYRISNSMYKRIQERKNRAYLLLGLCSLLQLLIIILCVTSGRDGIILACMLEPLFLYLVWRYLRNDIKALFYNNKTGVIEKKISDRSVNRAGVILGNAYSGWKREVKYLLIIKDREKEYRIELPTKDAFLSYNEGDEVQFVEFLPYPIITSRTPSPAVCPQCAFLLHYEDGSCHSCGLEDIYPDFCSIPKWERK